MARVNLPDALWETSVAWTLTQPEQVVLQSARGPLVLSRGVGLWHGEISVGVMATGEDASEVKAFVDSLLGSRNEFFIRMREDAAFASPLTNIFVASASIVGSEVVMQLQSPMPVPGLKRGNMFTMGVGRTSQSYRVVGDALTGARSISCIPPIIPGALPRAIGWHEATMLVRLREPPPTIYSDPSFTGPFSLSVVEAKRLT